MNTSLIKRKDILSVLTENYENLGYGGSVPATAKGHWGARTIWERGIIDIVADRQVAKNANEIVEWINSNNMTSYLEKMLQTHHFTVKHDDYLHVVDGEFNILASPNASHGYLYIVAWR